MLFKKKEKALVINQNGWTAIQNADAAKHVLEIDCYAEKGTVTEVRIRHNDGEEQKGIVLCDGEAFLPADADKFKEYYLAGKLTIK